MSSSINTSHQFLPLPTHHGFKDLTDLPFGRLVVLGYVGRKRKNRGDYDHYWLCRCKCGREVVCDGSRLKRGITRSCKCLYKKHGHHSGGRKNRQASPTYHSWSNMFQRCYNKKCKYYQYYGGRGIKVCERWHTFEHFLADMGLRPSRFHSIDRFPNNDGDYEPGNCRWTTLKQQMRNQRTNRFLTHDGQTHCLAEWAEIKCIPYKALHHRLSRNWSVEDALERPVKK